MKARYIVSGLLMSLSLSLSARTYKAGESIYINTDQSSSQESGQQFNWKNDGAKPPLVRPRDRGAQRSERYRRQLGP